MHSRRRKKIRLPLVEYDWTNIFSITVSTQDRYEWFAYHPRLADEIVSVVLHASRERGSGLFAWCVMPDHVHLLLRDADVVAFVRLFKGRCTPVARLFEKERRLWQRSFFDQGVRREESLLDIARYKSGIQSFVDEGNIMPIAWCNDDRSGQSVCVHQRHQFGSIAAS